MRLVRSLIPIIAALAGGPARGETLPPFTLPEALGLRGGHNGGAFGLRGGEVPLVDHQPHNFGGPASDTLFSEVPGGTPFPWQLVADDFMLVQAAGLRFIRFWAFYDSNVLPVGDETIRVRFYDARPSDGLPGDMLYEEPFLNVPRTWTGRNVITAGGGREYRFEVLLAEPFIAEAETKYWLEIAQIGDLLSHFRWEVSVTQPANGQAFSNLDFPNWALTAFSPVNPNTAFQLYSIPEPATFVLIAILAAMGARRSKRCRSTCGRL